MVEEFTCREHIVTAALHRYCSQHNNIQTIDEDTFSLPISTFSALGVSHIMRYINVRYLLTYRQYWHFTQVKLVLPSPVG